MGYVKLVASIGAPPEQIYACQSRKNNSEGETIW